MAFLTNFEDIVNRRVEIKEDTTRYQDTLSFASSKVHYSVGERIYMLPNNLNPKIRPWTVGYNNKILISEGEFSLGKNDEVNTPETPAIKSHKYSKTNSLQKPIIKHEDEKIVFVLFLTGGFTILVHVSMNKILL